MATLYWLILTSALAAVLLAEQAAVHRRSDVDLWKELGFNRFAILFRPDLLTPAGLLFRALSLCCQAILAVTFVIAYLLHRGIL